MWTQSTHIFFSPRYSILVARPKSAIFTCIASLMSMLPSLRSRCMTCRPWMYWQPWIKWLMKNRTSGSVSVVRVLSISTNDYTSPAHTRHRHIYHRHQTEWTSDGNYWWQLTVLGSTKTHKDLQISAKIHNYLITEKVNQNNNTNNSSSNNSSSSSKNSSNRHGQHPISHLTLHTDTDRLRYTEQSLTDTAFIIHILTTTFYTIKMIDTVLTWQESSPTFQLPYSTVSTHRLTVLYDCNK